MKCLCSHHQALHQNYSDGCIHWIDCSCVEFVEDCEPDDQKYPIPAPFSNHYADGPYKTPPGGWPL